MEPQSTSGNAESVILIKAAPNVSKRHGETVCCAGIDIYGNWLRLYPVSFRHLKGDKKFVRWDRVRFNWRLPKDDRRIESRRLDQESIQILGQLKENEREKFLAKSIVSSLASQRDKGKSLALLKAEIIEFIVERKSPEELRQQQEKFELLRAQQDLFSKAIALYNPCPYRFKYRYRMDDGIRFGSCQDWEIEATYFRWSSRYGEKKALEQMQNTFGEVYPKEGMLLAMGTHSDWPDQWLINGIIRLNKISQSSMF